MTPTADGPGQSISDLGAPSDRSDSACLDGRLKVICGLGNPGPEYAETRHNVGWWLVEHLAAEWGIGPFRKEPLAWVATGVIDSVQVRLLEPATYMNLSGEAIADLAGQPGFDLRRDLLVVVDDVALQPGRFRLRARGSDGGHNGLRSIEAIIGSREYARLRIGVGKPPPGFDLVDWVLAPMSPPDRASVLEQFPRLEVGVREWLIEGTDAAQRRLSR